MILLVLSTVHLQQTPIHIHLNTTYLYSVITLAYLRLSSALLLALLCFPILIFTRSHPISDSLYPHLVPLSLYLDHHFAAYLISASLCPSVPLSLHFPAPLPLSLAYALLRVYVFKEREGEKDREI